MGLPVAFLAYGDEEELGIVPGRFSGDITKMMDMERLIRTAAGAATPFVAPQDLQALTLPTRVF